MEQLIVYAAPDGAVLRDDFSVSVRQPGAKWQELPVYEVKVDMHQVRQASMVYFDMEGTVEVQVISRKTSVEKVDIRPLSVQQAFTIEGDTICFQLDRPRKLVIEFNGERFSNLHLFANPIERDAPQPSDAGVLCLKPAIHRTEDVLRQAEHASVIYFAPGMHWLEETILRVPSGKTIYIAGGAVVAGSLVCDRVEDVTIRGRGVLYLSDFHRFSAFRGVRIKFSRNISIEGITVIDPPHYSIYIGKSEHVTIRNFKSFSTRGWSDGIDMMASEHIDISDVFMRNSDDCIAVYGSRWAYVGDTRYVTVRDSILWADVAHAMNIGMHGNYHADGDTIAHIRFENIDILEHHERQVNYWGAMAINAGDKNTVRDVVYENIRVEDFEEGQLLDVRVVHNPDYNPAPGRRIEHVIFRNIAYNGQNDNPSRIHGYSDEYAVDGVTFINLRINGELIADTEAAAGKFDMNTYARHVVFRAE